MSRKHKKRNNLTLPTLQREIVVKLGEKGPQTINSVRKAISGHYKSTWKAIDSLQKKGFIEKSKNTQQYRGREFTQYWLTLKGLAASIKYGADINSLRKQTLKEVGDNRGVDAFFDLIQSLGSAYIEEVYTAFEQLKNGVELVRLPIPLRNSKERESMLKGLEKSFIKYPKWIPLAERARDDLTRVIDKAKKSQGQT